MRRWVLIRGLAREKRHWGEFLTLMHNQFSEDELITVDLPGTGEYHNLKSPKNIKSILSFAREKALKDWSGPISIVSMSFGSMLALKWQELYEDEIQLNFIVNTSLKQLSPVYKRLRYENLGQLVRMAKTKDPLEKERILIPLLSNQHPISENTVQQWAEINKTAPIAAQTIWSQLIAAARFKCDLQKIDNKKIVICYSEHDQFVHSSCSKNLAMALEVEPYINDWAGHDLFLDDPKWVVEKLTNIIYNYNNKTINT